MRATLCGYDYSIANLAVPGNTHLASKNYVLANFG